MCGTKKEKKGFKKIQSNMPRPGAQVLAEAMAAFLKAKIPKAVHHSGSLHLLSSAHPSLER